MLKAALTSAPVLRVWDPARPTHLDADASELPDAVSAMLKWPDDAGALYLLRFRVSQTDPPGMFVPAHLLEALLPMSAATTARPSFRWSSSRSPTRRRPSRTATRSVVRRVRPESPRPSPPLTPRAAG